jgi:group I intron endonuclease
MIIYKTINLINGKFYIGQDSKNNPAYLGSGTLLNAAIKKYGIENFKKEILEHCETKSQLNEREKYWIKITDARNVGYNIAEGGTGGNTFNEEISKRVSDRSKGRKLSKETIDKIRRTKNERLQKDPTIYDMKDDQKIFLSKLHSGKTISEEQKQAMRDGIKRYHQSKNGDYSNLKGKCGFHMKGKTLSPEHRKKISEGNRGKKMSDEFVEKTRQRMTGKGNPMYGRKNPHSEEYKQSMRGEGNHFYGKTHSNEAKQKISEARKSKTPEQKLERYVKFVISKTGKEPTEEQKRLKYEEYCK